MKPPIKKKWSQNFINDKNIINKIISISNPKKNDIVIEIGPGRGALTSPLSKVVKKIFAIEIDPMLSEYLKDFKIPNLIIINQDFLKWEIKINERCRVIGNLPYYISSPIIFKLIKNNYVNEIIIMVQKELGERLSANPNNKTYSRMSVVAQAFCDIKYECEYLTEERSIKAARMLWCIDNKTQTFTKLPEDPALEGSDDSYQSEHYLELKARIAHTS